MSRNQEADKPPSQTKPFGKTERLIPHKSQQAKKYYPAEDERIPKKVRPNPPIDLPITVEMGNCGEINLLE